MEANDIVRIAESAMTLDELPYDVNFCPEIYQVKGHDLNFGTTQVHQKLFSYVLTEELISVWRLVSTNWSHFASALCRQRSVSLRMPRDHEIVSSPIGHLFTDADNLPFSAAILELGNTTPEGHVFSNYAAKRFGEHLKSAEITTHLHHYAAFFETLRRTPNLVTLEVLPADSEGYMTPTADYTFTYQKIQLPVLKSLKMRFARGGHFMRLLDISFRDLAPQLDSMDLELNGSITDAEFNRCAILICSANFRKLTLRLPFETMYSVGWKTLVDRGPFDIQNLTVSFCNEDAELLDMTSDLLERFLVNCRGLTSLTLDVFERRSLTSNPVRVPVMPTVKQLDVSLEFMLPENAPPITKLQLEPLTAGSFPSLTEVTVNCQAFDISTLDELDLGRFFDVRQIFDVSEKAKERFLGVTSLNVGPIPTTTNWADVFPNVKNLSATLEKAEQLASICTNMSQVTELDLRIDFPFPCPGFLRHLRHLEMLKTLTLYIYELEDEIAMFTTLSPLNLKFVYETNELSDKCLSLLRNQHPSVEVLKEEDD